MMEVRHEEVIDTLCVLCACDFLRRYMYFLIEFWVFWLVCASVIVVGPGLRMVTFCLCVFLPVDGPENALLCSKLWLSAGLFFLRMHCKPNNTENLRNIPRKGIAQTQSEFPHSCVCVCDLYIPTIDLLQEICGPILGIYKSLTGTWMWKLGLRRRNSRKRNT